MLKVVSTGLTRFQKGTIWLGAPPKLFRGIYFTSASVFPRKEAFSLVAGFRLVAG